MLVDPRRRLTEEKASVPAGRAGSDPSPLDENDRVRRVRRHIAPRRSRRGLRRRRRCPGSARVVVARRAAAAPEHQRRPPRRRSRPGSPRSSAAACRPSSRELPPSPSTSALLGHRLRRRIDQPADHCLAACSSRPSHFDQASLDALRMSRTRLEEGSAGRRAAGGRRVVSGAARRSAGARSQSGCRTACPAIPRL